MVKANQDAAEQDGRSGRLDLAVALGVAGGKEIGWRANDFGEILRHQLESTLASTLGIKAQKEIDAHGFKPAGKNPTFRDLFRNPAAPLSLIQIAKDFAKVADSGPIPSVPTMVALVLYQATIAAALIRHGQVITSLKPEELKKGLDWLEQQRWVDEQLRLLGKQATEVLGGQT